MKKSLRLKIYKLFSSDSSNNSNNSLPGASTRNELISQINKKQFIPIFDKKTIYTEEYFKKRGDHMRISDSRLKDQNQLNTITGYDQYQILVNDITYPGPIIVTKTNVFMWEIDNFEYLNADHLKLIDLVNPKPEYVIISSGVNDKQLPKELNNKLKDYPFKIDCLNIFLASGTFNMCMEQEINTIGFFWLQ